MPLVSFVMPNRNKAVYLPEAIECLQEQTLKNIEIIIVDDDSTDDSRDIIDTYANKDRRIVRKYLGSVEGLPVAERIDRARNIGNKIARSSIICVSDSDDWSLPKRAEITYETFKNKPECDLFYGSFLQRNRYGRKDERIPDFFPADEFSKRFLKLTGLFFIGHLTIGYKKETILKYPYNSYAGVGDWGMLYNLLIRVGIKSCYTKDPVCIYRVYGNAMTELGWKGGDEHIDYLWKKKQKKMELLGELRDIQSL